MANQSLLNEQSPAEQAHALGLTYGGFGGWIDKSRTVKAYTIDGHLVRAEDKDNGNMAQDMGRMTIFRFDPQILTLSQKAPNSRFVWKYNAILKSVSKLGTSTVMLVPRGEEHTVADYLRKNGIQSGVKLATINADDPNKVRDYVADKIKSGFSNINYFDTSKKGIAAVDSLHAQYNKKDNLHLKTHQLTAKGDNASRLAQQ